MTPTPKLRFVERDSYSRNGEFFSHPHKVTILQQWWEDRSTDMYYPDGNGKWVDIPVEAEDFTKNKTSG